MAVEERELTKAQRKQIRARARRARKQREVRKLEKILTETYKPMEEWDAEELARGRPRAADGTFRGPTPKYVNRSVHEEAVRRFKDISQADLRALVPSALLTVQQLLESEEEDDKGRPLVPPAVKLAAAQWVVEHLVGKPTQRQELDISVKLQGILGQVMVTPGEDGTVQPSIDATYRELESPEE